MMQKKIEVEMVKSVAGGGKTQAAMKYVAEQEVRGERFLYVCKSIDLTGQVYEDLIKAGVPSYKVKRITSDNDGGVCRNISGAVDSGEYNVLIITEKAFTLLEDLYQFNNWQLIIDEVPKVVELKNSPFNDADLSKLSGLFTQEQGKIVLSSQEEAVLWLSTSINSDSCKGVVKALSERGELQAKNRKDKEGNTDGVTVYWYEIKDMIKRLEPFKKRFLMAANIENMLSAKAMEFQGVVWKTSTNIVPKHQSYINDNLITIYPLLQKGLEFKTYAVNNGTIGGSDVMHTLKSQAVRVMDDNGVTEWIYTLNSDEKTNITAQGAERLAYNSHGINSYRHLQGATGLFRYGLSNEDKEMLKQIAELYNRSHEELIAAWYVEHYLEPNYQLVTRGCCRDINNQQPYHIVCADERVVNYLLQMFPKAKVDWSFAASFDIKVKQTPGRKPSVWKVLGDAQRKKWKRQSEKYGVQADIKNPSHSAFIEQWAKGDVVIQNWPF